MSGFALLSFAAATKQHFDVALKGLNPKNDVENLRDLQAAPGKVPAASGGR